MRLQSSSDKGKHVPNVRDTFALPRDPDHAIHVMEGSWEYCRVPHAEALECLDQGWYIVSIRLCDETHVLLKYTHHEQCGCRRVHGTTIDL